MRDEDFEWDDAKAHSNLARHRVSFEMARDALDDPLAVGWLDESERYGEDRFVMLGLVDDRLLSVVYTMRGDRIRLISARAAEPWERRRYHGDDT